MIDRLNQLRRRAGKLRQDPVAKNSAALYGVQFCRKLFPLFTVPYLTRMLNPAGWGTVAFVLSMAEIVALIIEFGFNLSATREISRQRHHPEDCRDVMGGVLGAQALLAMVGIGLAAIVTPHITLLRNQPKMVIAGLIYAVAQGCTPLWFFQGLERLRLAAGLEIGAKFAALCGVFLLVRSPQDGWKVVVLQAMAAGVSTTAGIGLAVRSFGFRFPNYQLVKDALQRGWPMFVFRSAESLYGIGNVFLLGLFAPAAVVGYFATAEKITKAMFGLLNPIRDSLYPRLSYLAASSEQAAARLARPAIALMVSAGLFLTTVLFAMAPWFIKILAGPDFAPAVPVLRLYSILPLVLSITYSVGLQWLIPLGRDAAVNRIIVGGGLLNLALSCLFAPRLGAMGMATSVLLSELYVCTNMVWVVWRSTNLWKTSASPLRPGVDATTPSLSLEVLSDE
ncbi:MAG TPA: flippase [Terriglobales bacterium]|nr:flippase [Terriglobales bacterium]